MPGLLRGLARTALVAGTATAVSNRVSRRQAGRWAAEAPAPPPYYAPPPPPSGGESGDRRRDDVLDQLRELGELRSAGVLTEQEFEDQKRRILGS